MSPYSKQGKIYSSVQVLIAEDIMTYCCGIFREKKIGMSRKDHKAVRYVASVTLRHALLSVLSADQQYKVKVRVLQRMRIYKVYDNVMGNITLYCLLLFLRQSTEHVLSAKRQC